jgi:hypothetical protein
MRVLKLREKYCLMHFIFWDSEPYGVFYFFPSFTRYRSLQYVYKSFPPRNVGLSQAFLMKKAQEFLEMSFMHTQLGFEISFHIPTLPDSPKGQVTVK